MLAGCQAPSYSAFAGALNAHANAMTTIVRPNPTESPQNEYDYTTSYHKWDGMCRQVPILESILNGIADAVVASWQTVGPHEKAAAKMLDGMRGSGKQHFDKSDCNGH